MRGRCVRTGRNIILFAWTYFKNEWFTRHKTWKLYAGRTEVAWISTADTEQCLIFNVGEDTDALQRSALDSGVDWSRPWCGFNAQKSNMSRTALLCPAVKWRPQVWPYTISILSYSAVESRRTLKEVMGRRRMKGRRIAITALCGATAATSMQRSVWGQRGRKERWDRDVNGFCETGFVQNFRMMRATFHYSVCFCLWFCSYDKLIDLKWFKSCFEFGVTCQKSDLYLI